MTLRHEAEEQRAEWYESNACESVKTLMLDRARRFDKEADIFLGDDLVVYFQINGVQVDARLSDSLPYDGSLAGFNVLIDLYEDDEHIGVYCPYNFTDRVWTDDLEELKRRIKIGFDLLEEEYPEHVSTLSAEQKEAAARIERYIEGFMEALSDGEVPLPGAGDCWYCAMRNKADETLGEAMNSGHLESHIEEGYYVPSLLMRAIEEYEVAPMTMMILQSLMGGEPVSRWDLARSELKGSLRSYLFKHLVREE